MPGLLDIAPAAETVTVRGTKIDVYGVSIGGVTHLLRRFPELRAMMAGKEVDVDALLNIGGDCAAAIIAAGCGVPGNEEAEQMAARLSLSEQADLLEAIIRLTMPDGVGPFVERLERVGGVLGASISEAPTDSPKQSSD